MKTRGDVIILGLCERQTDAIIDIKLGDADAETYRYEPTHKLLYCWGEINKEKYVKNCHKQRKLFYLFTLLLDGVLGREILVVHVNLSRIVSVKMNESLSHVLGWIIGQIAITIASS